MFYDLIHNSVKKAYGRGIVKGAIAAAAAPVAARYGRGAYKVLTTRSSPGAKMAFSTRKRYQTKKHALKYGDKKLFTSSVSKTLQQNTFYTLNLADLIALGDGGNKRKTEKIIIKKYRSGNFIDFDAANWPANACSGVFRLTIFTHDDFVANGSSNFTSGLAASEVFTNSAMPTTSPFNYNKIGKVLYDRKVLFSTNTGSNSGKYLMPISFAKAINRAFTYDNLSTSEGKLENIYIGISAAVRGGTDNSTDICTLSHNMCLSFTDK